MNGMHVVSLIGTTVAQPLPKTNDGINVIKHGITGNIVPISTLLGDDVAQRDTTTPMPRSGP